MSGLLNLSDADMGGFQPIEPGRYAAKIHEMKMDSVKNTSGTGKMPAGTPMIKVQFRIDDERYPELTNRAVFVTYVIPPKEYDPAKAAKIKGMLVRFFVAMGESEEHVMSNEFAPDFDDYKDRKCVVTVGKEQKRDQSGNIIPDEWNNPVKGVKHISTLDGTGASMSGGLL